MTGFDAASQISSRAGRFRRFGPGCGRLFRLLADRAGRGPAAARFAVQRVRRGWADSDVWELNTNLCLSLAAQLEHLAAAGSGWPQGERCPHSEDWAAALRSAAVGLRGWAESRDERDEDLPRRYAEAQTALRWVADNLDDLWD